MEVVQTNIKNVFIDSRINIVQVSFCIVVAIKSILHARNPQFKPVQKRISKISFSTLLSSCCRNVGC